MAFKDFMKAILNEDVELDEDEVEEEVVEEPVQEEPAIEEVKPVVEEPQIAPISAYPEDEVELFTKPVIEPQSTPKSSIFAGLDVEEVTRRETRMTNKPYKYDRRKMMKLRTNEDLDYKPIISPIFGDIKEEEKKFEKVHDAIKLPKPVDDASFVQILSPMYGTDIPQAKPVESIPTMKPEPKKVEASLSLDDMLEKPKQNTTKQEDLFSLKD